ncbi:hypothetical protein GCM10023156_52640 [Novipirellula rosea]|uniref:Uncharacterized protein n=1 Tax=Novipirellula rosea TaxID=1031540 RepID=A0ABP8NCT6_9BACT
MPAGMIVPKQSGAAFSARPYVGGDMGLEIVPGSNFLYGCWHFYPKPTSEFIQFEPRRFVVWIAFSKF